MIMIHSCRFCETILNEPALSFNHFPMYSGSVSAGGLLTNDGEHFCYDFGITICPECGLIQQYEIPDLNIRLSITNVEFH